MPVIVLSNNDGCAIARSEEAKALHVRMGDPVFKMRDRIKRHGIQLRSSNYELYADLNRRFNAVIADHSDMAQSAPSCDFGQVGERFGNVAFGIDDGNHRRGQFAP
ncbi:Y-family DNA polymerase, partial [Sphingobium xenophagum]